MKKYIFVAVFVLLAPELTNLIAQDSKIYIREYYGQKSLELLLLDLSMNYNIDFVFDHEEIHGILIKSKNIKGLELETAMKAYLKGTYLDFRIENGRTIHITPYVEVIATY